MVLYILNYKTTMTFKVLTHISKIYMYYEWTLYIILTGKISVI